MAFPLSVEKIAALLNAPAANVHEHWPILEQCLDTLGLTGNAVKIAALATVRVECPPFKPIHEYGSDAWHEKVYGGRIDLGNRHPGDGAKYAGRGFIQVTGELNYAKYGALLGTDLVNHPDVALEDHVAASILAIYFQDHGIGPLAEAGQWTAIRKKVNGGTNGLADFLSYVQKLNNALRG